MMKFSTLFYLYIFIPNFILIYQCRNCFSGLKLLLFILLVLSTAIIETIIAYTHYYEIGQILERMFF